MLLKAFFYRVLEIAVLVAITGPAFSQSPLLGNEWKLDAETSSLTFQSVKNGAKVETSSFASFDGSVDANGVATMTIQLDSIDTAVDLRNVRMRFLFFETFKYPTATVRSYLTEEMLADLAKNKRTRQSVDFELDLHGIKKTLAANTVLTMFAEDQISIATSSPVSINAEDFGLSEGIIKLQDTANVQIVPSGSVSFDFTFKRIETETIESSASESLAQKPNT